eukprot:CAMPEP_0184327764 /NCGR_PEP_ID=MMETSP1049-20130417/143263_1 /TAXON_ID=77928 /ORGANISM="Proteomonas sulcata, Strain CCMP704" /LENGTH=224 /DNA_ID=CAMNT_0026650035 /DNA_START=466 /DNA_END=1140 /DNA_ORIENTATION=-
MRACGGAVQGIEEGGVYHNRNNDGFIAFDCGSYSAGPSSQADKSRDFMTSLCFSSGQRQLLTIPEFPFDGLISADLHGQVLTREPGSSVPDQPLIQQTPQLKLESELGCRMPSPNQPWMAQRLKWEKQLCQGSTTNLDESLLLSPSGSSHVVSNKSKHLIGWCVHGVPACTDIWTEWDGFASSTVIQVGGVCVWTGEAKALTRSFDKDGNLLAVVLQQGSAHSL